MNCIVGVDEVGRGCWAGPLVAGAVALADNFQMPVNASWKLGDSKTMTKRQREVADTGIRASAAGFGLGWVSAAEIDGLGLTKAVRVAMNRAMAALPGGIKYDAIIIDGNYNFLADSPKARQLIKADACVPAVSAASVLAKVARDSWMASAAVAFPGYGFDSHVGYGTRQHADALAALGPCELHRRSFRPVAKLC